MPDPVLTRGIKIGSEGFWMSHETPEESDLLAVDGFGAFVRALVPVHLTGGHAVTFGVWIGIPFPELYRASEVWREPAYVDLSMDGLLANDLPPWNVLGAPIHVNVLNADHTPYGVSSSDEVLSRMLTDVWDHELVLSTLPE